MAEVAKLSGDKAYEALYSRIMGGEIKPGERVREAGVAKEFGLSRTPVREVLQRLESEGLLMHQPHRGMVVKQLDHQAVTELYLMREVLEATAASMAAQHASDAEVAALQDILEEQRKQYATREVGDDDKGCRNESDDSAAANLNKMFHKMLVRSAHNRYLFDMAQTLSIELALLGRTTLSLSGRLEESLLEHQAILDAITARDSEKAKLAATAHIQSAHKSRLRVLFEDEA